jgi:hypothetical protein
MILKNIQILYFLNAKKRFLNNTIYTIGIQGRKITDFIEIFKENGIEYVLDIRDLNIDIDEPDFTEAILSRELKAYG